MDKKELTDDIKIELENLERLNIEMKNLLVKIGEEPTFIEVRAAASILHDFYSGIEKIFERIALSIDKHIPESENWHIELLSQMAKPFMSTREPVISENLFEKLQEYLKFRHLFRHIYGFELKWERFKSLCIRMPGLLEELKFNLKSFLGEKG